MNKLLILIALSYTGLAMACPSQIITLPDGKTMVCYYCNGGKIVNCEYL
jgi:hypothetical protein